MNNWQQISFNVPIQETLNTPETKEFLIRGTAINATTTRNGTKFLAEELQTSAGTLRNKPILKDHNNSVDSIIGRTTSNVSYDHTSQSVKFEGKIVDPLMKEKISEGLVTSVSIGAMLKDLETEKNDAGEITAYVARGIDFVELSLVAVPADPNAGFNHAIMQSFDLKQSASPLVTTTNHSSVVTVPVLSQTASVTSYFPLTSQQASEEQLMDEQNKIDVLRAERAKLEEDVMSLQKQLLEATKQELEKQLASASAASTPTTATETQGTIAPPAAKEEAASDAFLVERMGNRFAITADVQRMDGLTRLKR